jgi:ParB-like chromosome segregation protein Spo0J
MTTTKLHVVPKDLASAPQTISLELIDVPYDWNARSVARTKFEGIHVTSEDPEALGVEGLAGSLRVFGQLTPVTVQADVDLKIGLRYVLRAGFRRVTAARLLQKAGASIKGLPPGKIHATVYEALPPIEARLLNLIENTHESLIPSDVVWGLRDVFATNPKIDRGELAQKLSRSAAWVSRYAKLAEHLSSEVLARWRDAPLPLPVGSMLELADLDDHDAQLAEYFRRIEPPSAEDQKTSTWVKSAKKRGAQVGTFLGILVREKVVTGIVDDEAAWSHHVRTLVPFRRTWKGRAVSAQAELAIARAIQNAYQIALTAPELGGDEPDNDDDIELDAE